MDRWMAARVIHWHCIKINDGPTPGTFGKKVGDSRPYSRNGGIGWRKRRVVQSRKWLNEIEGKRAWMAPTPSLVLVW